MHIFLDTADVAAIERWIATGIIDGVTTNPSLLSKAGADPKEQIKKICNLVPKGDISVEVTEKEPEAVYRQAKTIAALGPNIVVKIPCHTDYYPVINRLAHEDVKLNITLVFSLIQGMMMCKLGARYISPFIGRWDDIDVEGVQLLLEMREMINTYDYATKLLAASIRGVRHLHYAIRSGADVTTVPVAVLEKSLSHVLTDQGIKKFDADWQKLGVSTFP